MLPGRNICANRGVLHPPPTLNSFENNASNRWGLSCPLAIKLSLFYQLEHELATEREKQSETVAQLNLMWKMLVTMTKVAIDLTD